MKEPSLRRRATICAAAAATLQAPTCGSARLLPSTLPLSPRLDASVLKPLTALGVTSAASDLRYPTWLKGTWRVKNTIAKFTMPLGAAFVDSYLRASAQEDVNAAETLTYTLSFVDADPPKSDPTLTVAQDRRFNAVEETAAFLSSEGVVITNSAYEINAAYPHGRILLEACDRDAAGDSRVSGRGSGANSGGSVGRSTIDLRVDWAAWDESASGGAFVTSELATQRVILPPDEYFDQTAVDTTYLEIITRFERPQIVPIDRSRKPSGTTTIVRARNRLVQYLALPGVTSSGSLNSSSRAAKLEGLADGRAISYFDYDWIMEKDLSSGLGQLGSPKNA